MNDVTDDNEQCERTAKSKPYFWRNKKNFVILESHQSFAFHGVKTVSVYSIMSQSPARFITRERR